MADYREPFGEPFEIAFNARSSSVSPEYRIDDNEGNTIASGAGTELGTTGIFVAEPTAPGSVGEWTIIWSRDGTFDPSTNAIDTLETYDPGAAPVSLPDLSPTASDGITSVGPCQLWATVEEIAEFCDAEGVGSEAEVYDEAALVASQILYAMSGRRFAGTCVRSVRPCTGRCGDAMPWPMTSDLYWGSDAWKDGYGRERGCGCLPLSVVPLAGAARSIVEVLIDGQIVDPDSYRLDERRRLVRMRDADGERQFWPGCQNLDAGPEEEGTFEITYRYGIDPPGAGVLAAKELACAIFQATPAAALDEECVLPNGVTKIVRQGVTYELVADAGWGYLGKDKGWRTGLPLVDMFLNAYNPTGRRRRRAMVWSPDLDRYPRPVGDPLAS